MCCPVLPYDTAPQDSLGCQTFPAGVKKVPFTLLPDASCPQAATAFQSLYSLSGSETQSYEDSPQTATDAAFDSTKSRAQLS